MVERSTPVMPHFIQEELVQGRVVLEEVPVIIVHRIMVIIMVMRQVEPVEQLIKAETAEMVMAKLVAGVVVLTLVMPVAAAEEANTKAVAVVAFTPIRVNTQVAAVVVAQELTPFQASLVPAPLMIPNQAMVESKSGSLINGKQKETSPKERFPFVLNTC